MRNNLRALALFTAAFLGQALINSAQAFSSPASGSAGYIDSGQVTPRAKELNPRQRLGENLALLKLLRMTKALDLTEEQASRIFPMANRLEKEKMELNRLLNQEIRELRSLVVASPPEEARIKEKVAKIKELRESIRLKEVEFENFLDKNLTVVQKGKYILFNLDFAQFLSRNIERMRGLQGQPPRAPIKKAP